MAKVLVLYYSMYGHIETMSEAVAEGARSVPGTEVTVMRVPETIPADQAAAHGVKLDQKALASFPEGYRHLAYIQTQIGYTVKRDMPQLTGAEVEQLYARGRQWLAGAAAPAPFASL